MFRPVRALSLAAIVLVALSAVFAILSAVWTWRTYHVVDDYVSGLAEDSDLDAVDSAGQLIVLSELGLLIVSGVVFVLWLWRVRANADLVSAESDHKYKRGWIIAGWIVPVVNFWIPRRLVVDVWRTSAPTLEQGARQALLNWWWAGWVATIVLDRVVAYQVRSGPDSVTAVGDLAETATLYAAVMVGTAVLAIQVVRRITAWQSVGQAFVSPAQSESGPIPVYLPQPVDQSNWQRPS